MSRPEPSNLTRPAGPGDHTQGPESALATLVVYGDYECPYTRKALLVVRQARKQMGDRLRFIFRNFPLTKIHPHALRAAEAAEAAAAQGPEQFWQMHTYLFAHQDALDEPGLRQAAIAAGLDMARYETDMAAHAQMGRIQEDYEGGLESGVMGTPTLFVNGRRYAASWALEALLPALEQAALPEKDRP